MPKMKFYNGTQWITLDAKNADYATNAGNADKVNNIQFRLNSGKLEYNDGTGWKSMFSAILGKKPYLASFTSPNPINIGNWYTSVDVTGEGVLYKVSIGGQYPSFVDIRITVDGGTPYQLDVNGGEYIGQIKFDNSLKIEACDTPGSTGQRAASFGVSAQYVLL